MTMRRELKEQLRTWIDLCEDDELLLAARHALREALQITPVRPATALRDSRVLGDETGVDIGEDGAIDNDDSF